MLAKSKYIFFFLKYLPWVCVCGGGGVYSTHFLFIIYKVMNGALCVAEITESGWFFVASYRGPTTTKAIVVVCAVVCVFVIGSRVGGQFLGSGVYSPPTPLYVQTHALSFLSFFVIIMYDSFVWILTFVKMMEI